MGMNDGSTHKILGKKGSPPVPKSLGNAPSSPKAGLTFRTGVQGMSGWGKIKSEASPGVSPRADGICPPRLFRARLSGKLLSPLVILMDSGTGPSIVVQLLRPRM